VANCIVESFIQSFVLVQVSGKSLLQCTEQEAVEIIQAAASPVKLLVQSCYSHLRMRNRGSQQRGANKSGAVNDGRRAAIHSWYIEEEEDPRLRKTFPDAEGHLFEVTLQREGKSSLGAYVIVCDRELRCQCRCHLF